jgi:GNAT superfamily N-acetyltransferase
VNTYRRDNAIVFRQAVPADIPNVIASRAGHPDVEPADPRMGAYLDGKHHPQQALQPRIIFICLEGDSVLGYIGGHLTRRFDCDGELQYLYVAPSHRRQGIAGELLALLADWFADNKASRVCVDVEPDNAPARAFYAHHGATDLSEYWLLWIDIKVVRNL